MVVADVNAAGAEAAAPDGGVGMGVDVSSETDVERMIADTVAELGRLDVLVNNAAIVPFTAWGDVDFAEWRRIMSVNLDGTFLCCHHAHPVMREAGYSRIVNISSNVVLAGTPNLAHYVASKGGVLGSPARWRARSCLRHHRQRGRARPHRDRGRPRDPHAEAFEFVQMLQCLPRRGVAADIAPRSPSSPPRSPAESPASCSWPTPGCRTADGAFVARAGVILAVTQVDRSIAFYRDLLGFDLEARYDDPPYATLARAGIRLSLAEQGHPAEDRPGCPWSRPTIRRSPARCSCSRSATACGPRRAGGPRRRDARAALRPPWGGHRFFVRDPDGYLVEVERPA